MDKWSILKNYIESLSKGKAYDNGHDKKRAFREI